MGRYIIKIVPTKECNADYAPGAKEAEGMECDDYLIIGFKDRKAAWENIMGISVDELRQYLTSDHDGAAIIMQAAQIAEGYMKALETFKRHEKKSEALNAIKDILLDALGDKSKKG